MIAALAEPKMIAGYALRSGNTACSDGASEFLRSTIGRLPSHVRVGLIRGDFGFGDASTQATAEELGRRFIFVTQRNRPVQKLCRHDDRHWRSTEVPGLEVQEIDGERPGRRLILIRQRITQRPQAEARSCWSCPGIASKPWSPNLPRSCDALAVWRRYNGRADLENRIKELGAQFGLAGLCCQSLWATEALHHLAIVAYNLCVLLQRWLANLNVANLALSAGGSLPAPPSGAERKASHTLRLAVKSKEERAWWQRILQNVTAPPNCNAVGSFAA